MNCFYNLLYGIESKWMVLTTNPFDSLSYFNYDGDGIFDEAGEGALSLGQDSWVIISVVGGSVAVLCLILVGINLMIYRNRPDKRQQEKSAIMDVILGIFIISSAVTVVSALVGIAGAGQGFGT